MFNGLDFFPAFIYLFIYSERYHLCPFPTVYLVILDGNWICLGSTPIFVKLEICVEVPSTAYLKTLNLQKVTDLSNSASLAQHPGRLIRLD